MKPFVINRSSWHYWININFANSDPAARWERNHSSLCSYWRATVLRLIVLACSCAIALFAIAAFVQAVYLYPVTSALLLGGVFAVPALLVGWFALVDAVSNHADKSQNIVVQRYHAWKLQICPPVDYE